KNTIVRQLVPGNAVDSWRVVAQRKNTESRESVKACALDDIAEELRCHCVGTAVSAEENAASVRPRSLEYLDHFSDFSQVDALDRIDDLSPVLSRIFHIVQQGSAHRGLAAGRGKKTMQSCPAPKR